MPEMGVKTKDISYYKSQYHTWLTGKEAEAQAQIMTLVPKLISTT